jgi:ergothioneine biosynthesis protein EgtB
MSHCASMMRTSPAVPSVPAMPSPDDLRGRPTLPRAELSQQFSAVRQHTLNLTHGLSAEDQGLQSMPQASPTKWHLAHSTWLFETLVLQAFAPDYAVFDPGFAYLFNSYYEALGPRHPRPQRALLSRPALSEVLRYRAHVDAAVLQFITEAAPPVWQAAQDTLVLGLHHEQQHQELLQTDIVHALACNPMLPAYRSPTDLSPRAADCAPVQRWVPHPGGVVTVGHSGDAFAFDNESPRHQVLLKPFELCAGLVSCAEFLHFVEDGGYQQPRWWLSDGWDVVRSEGWQAPLYWLAPQDPRAPSPLWQVFGPSGVAALSAQQPVMNLSFYEADAYARWAGARLPTEFEWEAASALPGMSQLHDSAWQWTQSAYQPYPGFQAFEGAAAEYNAKFMVGQMVLRGGSLATPPGHLRPTYRNFFPPPTRWQYAGLRLARDTAPTGPTT